MSMVEKPPDRVIIEMKKRSKTVVARIEPAVGLRVVELEHEEGERAEHEAG